MGNRVGMEKGDIVYYKERKGVINDILGGGIMVDFEDKSYLEFYLYSRIHELSTTPYEIVIVKKNYTPILNEE